MARMTLTDAIRRGAFRAVAAWSILAAYGLTLTYGRLFWQAVGVPA